MVIRTVRAVLGLDTPIIRLCKHVNWSYYEGKACLTTSTRSSEAFNRFLVNSQRIINASKLELGCLSTIWFYEAIKDKNGEIRKEYCTNTIQIEKDMKLTVLDDDSTILS